MTGSRWLPLLAGLIVGAIAGIYYAWVVDPVEYVGTAPASLRPAYKNDYLALIASAYAATKDLDRARARLQLFPDPDLPGTLGALAQERLATGRSETEARALALLAAQLGERPTPPAGGTALAQGPSATSPPPLPTPSPTPSATAPPTRTPTATPGAPFQLLSQEIVCDPDLEAPLIQVEVLNAAGQGVPGLEVHLIWDAGQDHFFTGLKPELGIGYGDFAMTEGVVYTVQLSGSDELVTGLSASDCAVENGSLYPGSWSLRFQQP